MCVCLYSNCLSHVYAIAHILHMCVYLCIKIVFVMWWLLQIYDICMCILVYKFDMPCICIGIFVYELHMTCVFNCKNIAYVRVLLYINCKAIRV